MTTGHFSLNLEKKKKLPINMIDLNNNNKLLVEKFNFQLIYLFILTFLKFYLIHGTEHVIEEFFSKNKKNDK